MAVTWRTLSLLNGLRAQVELVVDAQTRSLVRAWVDAWNEIEPDLNQVLLEMLVAGENVTKTQLLRSTRLRAALAVIAEHLQTLASQAGVIINSDLADVIATAGAAQASILDSQVPPGFMSSAALDTWSLVDANQIDAIVRRSTEQITSRTRALSREAQQAVRQELIRGVAAGSNPRVVARRILQRVEGRFNGGLTRALTISRTEILSAHREAARVGQAQHPDVLAGWRWMCSLGPRTCPACLARHGTFHDSTESGPNGHQNCRCARVPVAKMWAELGFTDIAEPEDLFPDAKTWFAGQPEETQVAIMGRRRLELLTSGQVGWDDLATVRHTPGWRDSWVPTPVKTLARRAAA